MTTFTDLITEDFSSTEMYVRLCKTPEFDNEQMLENIINKFGAYSDKVKNFERYLKSCPTKTNAVDCYMYVMGE